MDKILTTLDIAKRKEEQMKVDTENKRQVTRMIKTAGIKVGGDVYLPGYFVELKEKEEVNIDKELSKCLKDSKKYFEETGEILQHVLFVKNKRGAWNVVIDGMAFLELVGEAQKKEKQE